MVPDAIDPDAERRLQVLEHHTELGAGYRIALKDLELRGAREPARPRTVGLRARGWLRHVPAHARGDGPARHVAATPRRSSCPSDVHDRPADYLPDDYVVSQDAKLDVYRRLARYRDAGTIEELRAELRDRFGPLPAPAEALLALATLRIVGGALGIEGILVRGNEARITFRDSAAPR